MLGVALGVADALAGDEGAEDDGRRAAVALRCRPGGVARAPGERQGQHDRAAVMTAGRRVGRGRDVADSTRRRYVSPLRSTECCAGTVPDSTRGAHAALPRRGRRVVTLDRGSDTIDAMPTDAMPSLPVVLDVDTGVDDACALLLAALHPGSTCGP